MAKLLPALLLAAIVVLCSGQFDPEARALCFSAQQCNPDAFLSSFTGTIRQCCQESERGLSFQSDRVKGCTPCVVYGWNTTSLVARERDEPYTVGLVVRKGLMDPDLSRLRYGVMLAAGSATEGDDFVFERRSGFAFTSLVTPLSLTLFLDGVEREGDETFALELVLTRGIQEGNFFFDGRLDVIIEDGDPFSVNITIEVADVVVTEGERREVCVVAIQKDFMRSIPVQIVYMDGTATEGIDYLAATTEVTISPESNFEGCFNLSIINDNVYESQKEFFFSINTTDVDTTINNPSVAVLIQDEDSLVIGWERESYSVSESEVEATVCVTIEGTPDVTLPPITLSTVDGTATEGMDYVAISNGVNITFSETSPDRICVPVQLIDDLVFESLTPEFFLVELSFPGFDRVVVRSQSTQVNITDNEVVSIGFMPVSLTVSEGQGSFSACVTKDRVTVEGFDVTIVSMAGSAMNGTDFDPSKIPSLLTLQPADDMACFTADDVIIDNTVVLEPTVSFSVRIDSVEPFDAARMTIQEMLEVFIVDDDSVTIGFTEEAVEVSENVGVVGTCIEASTGEFSSTLEVDLVYQSISAQEDDDYVPLVRTVTFIRPDTRTCFNISIVDDEIHEDVERFVVLLSPQDSRVVVAQQNFTVTIRDEDSVVIGWEVTTFTVDEGDGEVELCAAILSGTISVGTQVLDIFLPPASGNAEIGMDYGNDAVPATLEFEPSGPTQLCTSVDISDDNEIESFEDEDFFVVLQPRLIAERISTLPDMVQVFITDNEVVNIGFQDPSVTVGEEEASFTVCLVKNETVEEVEVALSVAEGTAINGTDYLDSVIPQSVILPPEDTTTCFTFPAILDDSLALEPDESFLLEISDTSPNDPNRVALGIAQVEIIIVDDDNVIVGFVLDGLEVTEDVGTFQVCVNVSTAEYEGDIEVMLSYEDGTAQEGRDFTVVDRSLVFSGTSQQECFSVNIVDDLVYEDDLETFSITLSSTNTRVLISRRRLNVGIIDEDDVTFQFVDGVVEVVEDEGLFEVCVVSSAVLMDQIELTLSYDSITAQEGDDFTVVNRSLVFIGSSRRECFSVATVDDSVYEDLEEMFTISLSSSRPRVQFNQSSLVIVIQDEDIVSVEFENADYTILEDASFLTVCAMRDASLATPITVGVVSTDITATDGVDYLGGTFSITFSAASGETECLNVTILEDGEPEPDETFVLSFVPSSIPDPRVHIGTVTNTTVTIRDPIIGIDVNDTISGDPVLTVPILIPDEQLESIPAERLSLCYEVHGKANEWFNIVSDECTSVNALYVGLSERLNIIDDITVKTVDTRQQCINISVSVENGCRAEVGGATVSRYSFGGVSVRTYNNRVRISVPNCNDLTLVMWVLCEDQDFQVVDDLGDTTSMRRNAIKFMVMRGLNYGNRLAHGLIGQFWNVPVSIAPFTGRNIFGETLENHYMMNITTRGDRRSYVGMVGRMTWQREEGPCLYVGDSQSFSIYEVEDPNDAVIQGIYTDYIVSNGFDDSFKFSVFEEDRCN